MTDISIQYIAGFFDAEGYVGVRYSKTTGYHVFQASITNNHKGVLEKIQKVVGGTLIAPKNYGVKAGKIAWVLSLHSKEGITFLDTIYPYLIIKKEQVRVALQYPLNELRLPLTEEMKQTRQSIMDQLKVLKRSYIDVPDDWQSTKKILEDEPIVQKAVALYLGGMETKEVAKELGAKINTVSYWLRTLKVNRSREEVAKRSALIRKDSIATRPDAQEAVKLFDEGLSIAEVARQLDAKYGTVYNWLRNLGRTRTLAEAQKIRRQREGGISEI